jgi:outer membrane scaffolding protein for murein synthesis (MipA/OmpV family)
MTRLGKPNAVIDGSLLGKLRAPAGALFLFLALPAHAELKPEWEFGAGATAFTFPDYRGSDESRTYVLPFPYVIYRGDKLRVDRQGLRGIFFESERVEIDFSASGTPPVDSDKNRAREGMPHLDPTLELGPRLNVKLLGERAREWAVNLRMPIRAVIATDLSHAEGAGYVAYPHLTVDTRPVLLGGKWNLGLQAGPLYGTRKYHRYFYSVDPEFATAGRPAYAAPGGYSGSLALVSITRRVGRAWLGAFARYDTLKGAAFESSPLVRRDYAVMAGIAFAWVFAESERRVEVDVDD